jgi:hypothetical protein
VETNLVNMKILIKHVHESKLVKIQTRISVQLNVR